MVFLNFAALAGLAAVSIPIIIHLLNQLQVKEVEWAAMRFLRESLQKNRRRLQLEDLFLLLLRCLLVALLVLALARPTYQSKAASSGSHEVAAVLIIDDSYSMGLTNGITTSFQRAQAAAEQVLAAFPSGSSAALFFAADNVKPVVAQPTFDFNLLRARIREARLTDRGTDLSHAIQLAVTTLKKHKGGESREIYIVTDGQASGWPSVDEIRKELGDVSKEIVVHLVLVGDAAESNLGVTGLRLGTGLTPVNQPLRCSVEVTNGSDTEARDVKVSLNIDDQPAADETIIDSIPANGSRNVALFAKLRSEGYHTITASIPHDRLPADDQRTLAAHALQHLKVLLVDGNLALRPADADDFFVRNALTPVAPADLPNYFIKTTTVVAAQLGATSLGDYDAVYFLGVDSIDPAQVQVVMNYVKQGGGLVIFPGPACNLDFYNSELGRDNFLPAKLMPCRGDTNTVYADKFFTLQTDHYEHPITALWNDPAAGTLGSARFIAYYPLQPIAWNAPGPDEPAPTAGEPRVALSFAQTNEQGGKDPEIVEHTYGLGRVIMFASTPTTAWNDLPVRPAFVPLMQNTLGSLVQRQEEGLNIRVGQPFIYTVNNDYLHKDFTVTAPGQTDPPRVAGQVVLAGGFPTVEYDDTDYAGTYKVSIATDPPTVIDFAAQADPAESNLTPLSAGQLKSLGNVCEVIKWSPDVSLTPKLTSERVGTELWFPLLVAALAIAAIETFVAQVFTKSK